MTRESEYPPPPDASHEEIQPFPYGNQQPIPPSDHLQNTPAAAANMQEDSRGMQGYEPVNPYGPTYGQPHPSTPQQLAQRGLAVGPNQDSSENRSKASRACDECRRKKTKCDADSEQPGVQCSACRRTNQTCAFTRPPQKRGPNKGYIKDLEHRLRGVESQIGANSSILQYPPSFSRAPGPYPPSADYGSRKRAFSEIEGSIYNQAQPQYPAYLSQQHITNPETLPREDQAAEEVHRSLGNTMSPHKLHVSIPQYSDALDKYYALIHPLLPLLPNSRTHQQNLLDHAQTNINDVFFAALVAAATSCTSSNATPLTDAKPSFESLRKVEPRTRTSHDNFVYVQALILMIIATENSGPSSSRNLSWYADAVEVARFMGLPQYEATNVSHPDQGTSGFIGRRVWLVLATLDRWHAASKSGMMLIPRKSAQLTESDENLLGTPAYHLARLSVTLGAFTEAFLYQPPAIPKAIQETLVDFIYDTLEAFRVHLRPLFPTTPHLHLAYLQIKLLVDRHLNEYNWSEYNGNYESIVSGALQMVTILCEDHGASAITHHCAGLAALTLAESMDLYSADKAMAALDALRQGLQSGHIRQLPENTTAWDASIISFITKKLDHGGMLAGLANAAAVESETNGGQPGAATSGRSARKVYYAWDVATQRGYLNQFE